MAGEGQRPRVCCQALALFFLPCPPPAASPLLRASRCSPPAGSGHRDPSSFSPSNTGVCKSGEGRGVRGRALAFPSSAARQMDAGGCPRGWPKPSLASCPSTFPHSRLCLPWGILDLAEAARHQLLPCPSSFPQARGAFWHGDPGAGAATSSPSARCQTEIGLPQPLFNLSNAWCYGESIRRLERGFPSSLQSSARCHVSTCSARGFGIR